jgi:hypothetical protein
MSLEMINLLTLTTLTFITSHNLLEQIIHCSRSIPGIHIVKQCPNVGILWKAASRKVIVECVCVCVCVCAVVKFRAIYLQNDAPETYVQARWDFLQKANGQCVSRVCPVKHCCGQTEYLQNIILFAERTVVL